jgi:hypothetical protein
MVSLSLHFEAENTKNRNAQRIPAGAFFIANFKKNALIITNFEIILRFFKKRTKLVNNLMQYLDMWFVDSKTNKIFLFDGREKSSITKWFLLVFLFVLSLKIQAQSCQPNTSNFQFVPTTKNRIIEWDKFPEFTLPFKIIYGGPRFGDAKKSPLKHGFSHLATYEDKDADLDPKNRAWLWYGVAYAQKRQPWETARNPWGNDMNLYNSHFEAGIKAAAGNFNNTVQGGIPDVDIFLLDIERQHKSNDSILSLKNHPLTPISYKNLDNQSFILQYKKDLQALYTIPFAKTRASGIPQTMKLGAYADTPIGTNYINFPSNNWQKWTTDATQLNFLNYDFSKNKLGGSYHDQQDFWSPTGYFFFDYPNPLASEYLAYLLFQVEVNRAWSDKPIIPFVAVRYFYDISNSDKFIKPFMAEATAIFPFFSGANGLWLWDAPTNFSRNENFAGYEYFINGLYRLSLYKNFFEGKNELVIPTPALQYTDTPKPIWRGVVKDNQLLVAAHNPYAKNENEIVNVPISYRNWSGIVTLKGYEVFLCKFDLSITNNEDPAVISSIEIMPNPTSEILNIKINSLQKLNTQIELIDLKGRVLSKETVILEQGNNSKSLRINQLSYGTYFVRVLNTSTRFVKE